MPTLESVILSIIESVGVPLILKLIASRSSEAEVRAVLDAEYRTARAAADAEAQRVL